jgi:hypothetical protein
MRPLGEISLALLGAAQELRTPDRAPTLAEMAAFAQVGTDAARDTVKNLTRHSRLRIVRKRRVDYVNKPVAEYEPVTDAPTEGAGFVDLGQVLTAAWR